MGAGDYAAFLRWYVASRCLKTRSRYLSAASVVAGDLDADGWLPPPL
jgi:hypothetical protein